MSEYPLSNLRQLKEDMIDIERAVEVFAFSYKKRAYFIAVCILTEEDRKRVDAQYALVRLRFMKSEDIDTYIDCYANSIKITAGMTELRKFLGVEYQEDGIGWLRGFIEYLGRYIPIQAARMKNPSMENIAVHTICSHEGLNPNRIYRHHLMLNGVVAGKQKHRTEYNGQLASIKYPKLYPLFKNDKTISFAFTDNKDKENSEEKILQTFEKNHGRY